MKRLTTAMFAWGSFAAIAAMALVSLVSFAVGVPLRYQNLLNDPGAIITPFYSLPSELENAAMSHLSPLEASALESMGISREFYAGDPPAGKCQLVAQKGEIT